MWPWRRRLAEAEQRLSEAEERTKGTEEIIRRSQEADAKLRGVVDRNGFGEALLVAMERRRRA